MICTPFPSPGPAPLITTASVSPAIEHLWVCLHGYDQPVAGLAAQFVDLDTPEYLLILPEALSRPA